MSEFRPFPRWDASRTAGLDEPGLLLYRSNLLGSDLRITNYGGGNTSAKVRQQDPLSGETETCCGSRAPVAIIGSMKLDGFSTLYLDKLHALNRLYRGLAHEDEMVGYLPHCTFNLNPRAASIDTPLHSQLPYAACRPHAPGCGDRHRRDARTLRSSPERSGTARLAGCPGCAPATSWAAASRPTTPPTPACAASCWAATACSAGARRRRAATRTPST
jgi:hypothetical protein